MAAINDILIPCALAAVRKDNQLRVYETAVDGGIREVQYEGQWMGGEPGNVIATGKVGTPIAATNIGFEHIRVYYVTPDNRLGEAAYDAGAGWYDGNLTDQEFDVAPYSSVAAIFLGGKTILRVYGQLSDNTIQEWVWDGSGWTKGSNLGPALPGTQIAATTWGKDPYHLRVYAQDANLNIFEKTWDGAGWHTGQLHFRTQVPQAALGVTSWGEGGSLGIRLYYGAEDNVIKEKAWDGSGGWYDGAFEEACLPGSNVAAIPLDILRVYLQNGTDGAAVTEFMWSDGWSVGYAALPPA
ncbi:fungal fucose-specific lectin [Parathielavia appendiculata]|uniref:Fungal fucose-specific lectin n=1 Tax=Parathielavia appendiculata TaxID=2587402 RepID=A0AAN6YYZ1_9PEZI|nr:fungal fucose-specific lectin [Parathielavia appendiculata]